MGARRADDRRDAALLAFHQTSSPAPPAPRPTGRSRRADWSRRMGAHQPVRDLTDEEVLRLLKQASAELGMRAWIVGGYVRDRLLGRPHPNPDGAVEAGDPPKPPGRSPDLPG